MSHNDICLSSFIQNNHYFQENHYLLNFQWYIATLSYIELFQIRSNTVWIFQNKSSWFYINSKVEDTTANNNSLKGDTSIINQVQFFVCKYCKWIGIKSLAFSKISNIMKAELSLILILSWLRGITNQHIGGLSFSNAKKMHVLILPKFMRQ